jgi:molybdate transport system regulatory protein
MAASSQPRRVLDAHGRFWFTLDGKNFLGHGRVELLQRIADTGSISQAAKAMKMSYKAAWDAVDAMNSAWGAALVESSPGGSVLTRDARTLMQAYCAAQSKHQVFMHTLAINLPTPAR